MSSDSYIALAAFRLSSTMLSPAFVRLLLLLRFDLCFLGGAPGGGGGGTPTKGLVARLPFFRGGIPGGGGGGLNKSS